MASKSPSRMNKAELLAEVKRLRQAQNGQGNGKGSSGKQVWKNYNGHVCKSAFTANISSAKIVRHLTAECGCDPDKGFRCKAVKAYGMTYDTLGSDLDASWTPLKA